MPVPWIVWDLSCLNHLEVFLFNFDKVLFPTYLCMFVWIPSKRCNYDSRHQKKCLLKLLGFHSPHPPRPASKNLNQQMFFLSKLSTLQRTNISPRNGILNMIFLFPRWDMLIPWRVFLSTRPPKKHILHRKEKGSRHGKTTTRNLWTLNP